MPLRRYPRARKGQHDLHPKKVTLPSTETCIGDRGGKVYDPKIKEAVIIKIQEGMSTANISRELSIPNRTIRSWIKNHGVCSTAVYTPRKHYSLEKKVEIINLWQEGMSIREISEQQGIYKGTIDYWIRDRNRLLAVYSVQEAHPEAVSISGRVTPPEKRLPDMGSKEERDLKRYNRDLKSENEYLRAKVAYLESLMELSGIPSSGFKKNSVIKPSTESSDRESET